MAWFFIANHRDIKAYQHLAKVELEKVFENLEEDISQYSFFTSGHPDTWVSSSRDDCVSDVQKSCVGIRYNARPAVYELKVDESNRRIYYVTGHLKNFDWDSLQHYDEWTESNRPTADQIAEFKQRRSHNQ